uniref:Uncharacterized protein n=1 Tax=Odontella aurita TaxID=265563 RepID=A0A7S4JIP8_9STRA|mmetsp:Transcript_47033/g.142413  ORF Transcript_47033/g.142413 Transcript_47033/m.142413 type:complete len:294 (+) Transcript_47033:890-1771(+)|eukprot:CAMPEP_0113589130 /NCGR_PEP_ID=MMETSP0015_2-20120614/35910_1 /TAXON_ID=2838 /ORGANISM="Odontella" /LENGTH=293 /DNA_ID=CAMNT_0000495101 /DNA_START=697 /DNA_END=1578 /DNA_ORIENTATION=+ /assembly_acc=CAM_ASM_000160
MLCCRNASAVVPSAHIRHKTVTTIDTIDTDDDASSSSCCTVTMKSKSPTAMMQLPQHAMMRQVWRKKPAPTSTSRSRSASAIAAPASPELVAPQRTQSQPLPSSSALGPEETRSVAEEEPVAAEAGGGLDGIFRLGTFAQADDDSSSFWSEERSSLLTLKRANPVFDSVDSEDEDEYDYQSDRECDYGLSSPFKRMRSSFLEEACDLADRRGEEEDEERLQDGARDAPAAAAAAAVSSSSTTLALGLGPGQSYYLPRTLWKMPSGEPFLGDTDDESESSDDCDRQGAACSEIF